MRSSTILLALAVACGLSVNAAEIAPVDRFSGGRPSPADRVPLLPGPYLLSPAGTPSLNGRTWKTIRFSRGEPRIRPHPPSTEPKHRDPLAPTIRASAPAPAAETLRFDATLPKLETSLPATKSKSQ